MIKALKQNGMAVIIAGSAGIGAFLFTFGLCLVAEYRMGL